MQEASDWRIYAAEKLTQAGFEVINPTKVLSQVLNENNRDSENYMSSTGLTSMETEISSRFLTVRNLKDIAEIDIMLIHEPRSEILIPSVSTCIKIGICEEKRIPMICTTNVKYIVGDPVSSDLMRKVAHNLHDGIEMVIEYFENLRDSSKTTEEYIGLEYALSKNKIEIKFVKVRDKYGIERYLVQIYKGKSYYNEGCIWPHNNKTDGKTGWFLDEEIASFCDIDPDKPGSPEIECLAIDQAKQVIKTALSKLDKIKILETQ